jgi:hypothetical protein
VKFRIQTILLIIAAYLVSTGVNAQEALTLEYHYSGDTGVNLRTIAGGPLSIADFQDRREGAGPHDIPVAGADTLLLSNQTISGLIRNALQAAFQSSGAQLSESSGLRLEGTLLDMKIQESSTGLEVLIRCELSLRNQGRSAWQSIVQSRTPIDSGTTAEAVSNGLDRLIRSLFMDDYFLMELGIF